MKKIVCLIIPCYRVKNKILNLYNSINLKLIDKIIIVDDCCPDSSGKFLQKKIKNKKKLDFLFLKKNQGVGGATIMGFKKAIKENYKIIIKLDGDGQHEPRLLKKFIFFNKKKNYDFCKGFRDLNIKNKKNMPNIRFVGNNILTLLTRLISGNWQIKDALNGYFSVKTEFLKKINLNKIKKNYFFEQDMIFNIVINKGKIKQIKTKTIYDDEKSNLKPLKTILPFLYYHFENLLIKIFC